MKYLLILLVFCVATSKAQTLNYYHSDGSTWQTLTFLFPPGNKATYQILYNSSTSESIQSVKELKTLSKDGNSASVVKIGNLPNNYLLISAGDGKHIVLSDDKQMFTTVYELDSYVYNPVVPAKTKTDFSPIAKGLVKVFSYLLL
jgi:hypothetical protein